MLLLLAAVSLTVASSATANPGESGSEKQSSAVIELTGGNYDSMIAQDNQAIVKPWMIMVYSTWCPHCVQLEPTWEKLAEKLEGRVRVGKINGPKETTLMKRLHITAFPTILHVDEFGEMRPYGDRSRDLNELYEFAVSGYLQVEPIPWFQTPHSWVGQMQKMVLELPDNLESLYRYLHSDLGLSDIFIIFSALIVPLLAGLVTIGVLDFIFVHIHLRSRRPARNAARPNNNNNGEHEHAD